MHSKKHLLTRAAGASVLAALLLVPGLGAAEAKEGFTDLQPEPDIVYLLANSSLIIGPDVNGPTEEITFIGPVHVPKFPGEGFGKRKLPSGRYQIDFELTRSELRGESFLLEGPVLLGEHPDLRSLGTITQRDAGNDYPADFIVQRKVLIQTPKGVMYNEDPVPVRGTIDSIPPVRKVGGKEELNVFHGRELPVALLDEKGELAGWFYSKVHVAYAIQPAAVYRMDVNGKIRLRVGDREEVVEVAGPLEAVNKIGDPAGKTEIIMMALRGKSELLGGQIMVNEVFDPEKNASVGKLGDDSGFEVWVQIKSPAGVLEVDKPIRLAGAASAPVKVDEVSLGKAGIVPIYHVALAEEGEGQLSLSDPAGRVIGKVTHLSFKADKIAGHRPCCPVKKGEETAKAGTAGH